MQKTNQKAQKTFIFIISKPDVQRRIDQFIKEKINDQSREVIKRAIRDGIVRVDGRIVKANYRLKINEIIKYEFIKKDVTVKGENIEIKIVYEDDDLAVIDKPSGLLTHPTPKTKSGTLVNGLLNRYEKLSDLESERAGIVHRLDKFTSGLIVVTKNDDAADKIREQFKSRKIKKEYIAVVHGRVKEKEGVCAKSIGRSRGKSGKMVVDGEYQRTAETQWEVIEIIGELATVLKLKPKTGRTHQIRVHMKEIGHPIIGDPIYKSRKQKFPVTFERQALHAHKLAFDHPKTGKNMEFTSNLPNDILQLIEKIRNLKL